MSRVVWVEQDDSVRRGEGWAVLLLLPALLQLLFVGGVTVGGGAFRRAALEAV